MNKTEKVAQLTAQLREEESNPNNLHPILHGNRLIALSQRLEVVIRCQ